MLHQTQNKALKFMVSLFLVATAALFILPVPTAYAQDPVMQATHPVSNTHTALLTSTVSITYNQNMDISTVSTQTFAVHAMETGLISQTYGVNGGTISLTPTNSFKPGELVQVSATTGTLDITGTNPLSPTVWQFRAQAGVGPAVFDAFTNNFGSGSDATRSVAWGDVDGDGDLDAAVGNYVGQQNVLYLNNGDG
ncbi:MAG: Ig-like domain-containing protein, partial [Chloroflexi bacterium]|nr:Ig-like domain-containing protein [Chloroflexota bacterium]